MSIESVMLPSYLILCCYLLFLPSIFPSIRVFSNELTLCIRWPKYWSFGISPSNEYSGLNSFRMDWLDLLAVQGTLKSLLQHHSSKSSILLLMLRYTHDQSYFLPDILHLELIPRQLRTWKTHGWSQPKAKGCIVWPSCHSPFSSKTDDILEKGTEERGF